MRNGSTEHSNQLKGYLRGENQYTKLNIPIHSDEAKWQMMCPGLRCTKINKLLSLHPGPPPAHQSTVCGAHRDLAMGAPGCGAQNRWLIHFPTGQKSTSKTQEGSRQWRSCHIPARRSWSKFGNPILSWMDGMNLDFKVKFDLEV